MKSLIRILAVSLIVLVVSSCKKQLDEKPLDFAAPENFFKTEAEAKSAVYSLYNTVVNANAYNVSLYMLNDLPSVELDGISGPFKIVDEFTYGNSFFWLDYYQGAYTAFQRANLILEKVPSITMDNTLKNAYLGEARYMRALHYFNLIRLFGDVPLVTNYQLDLGVATNNPRVNKENIYTTIIDDLKFAENSLPATYPLTEVGRATKGAAKTLLSLVYLTHKDYSLARDKSKEVMDLGVYSLAANYRDVFDPAKKNNAEHIFSVQYKMFRVGSWFESILSPPGTTGCGFADNIAGVNQTFFNNYPNSYRKDISMLTSYKNTAGDTIKYSRPFVKKYIAWGPENVCFSGENNFPVFRYAEVLLIFAEAENEVSGPSTAAYNAINAVRKRARTDAAGAETAAALPNLSGLSKDNFRKAVWREREMELCFEGHAFFDLTRTDRLISENALIGKTVNPKYKLYPIPQYALDANKGLIQNPGY